MVEQEVSCEVPVIGGGSAIATLPAWRGCDVLMLEKIKHTRFFVETDVTD